MQTCFCGSFLACFVGTHAGDLASAAGRCTTSLMLYFVCCIPQSSKTPKFVRGFVLFLAFAICKIGVEAVSSSMDAVQPKIILMILQQVCPSQHS